MFNRQKKHFKEKLENVEKMIWDLEFKRFKTREVREEVRQEYDNKKSRLSVLEAQIKAQTDKKTMPEDEFKRLEDEKALLMRDLERHEAQMKQIDVEVNGSNRTEEYPDGVTGITQQLESLRELTGMVKEYIKSL